MSGPKSKAELLDEMRREHAEWEALIAGADETRLTEPGAVGDRSVKDLVAHVMVYERWVVSNLGDDVPPDPAPPPDVDMNDLDQRNAWFYRANRDRPLVDVLADWRRFARRLEELVEALPEEQLSASFAVTPEGRLRPATESDAAPWPLWSIIDGNAGGHYAEHTPAFRAWLEQRGALINRGTADNQGASGS